MPNFSVHPNLEAFMLEFWNETIPNPLAGFERVWKYRAAFEVKPFDGRILLGCIRSLERGKGYGTAALQWLCALADKHGVTIRGSIEPVGETRPRLNVNQLRAWYKRHGFKVTRREIERTPKLGTCQWFLLCNNPAVTTVKHPDLGAVPTCARCAERALRQDECYGNS